MNAISGALVDGLKSVIGDAVTIVMNVIDAQIECWFLQVLQLDARARSLRHQE